jgi:hypothetical protein
MPLTRITNNVIRDETIVDADISQVAEIAPSKLGSGQLPSGITALATGSTTARSLNNRFSDVVNVKDFGATGVDNGTNDDAPAIRAAVAYAIANKKSVYFPSGEYPFRTAINGSGPELNDTQVGISINNTTFTPWAFHMFGDGATIKNYVYVNFPNTQQKNFKLFTINGYFTSITIDNIDFFDASPNVVAVPNKRTNYCFQFNEKLGETSPTLYNAQNLKISGCRFTNFCQGLNIYSTTNCIIESNYFLYEYGYLSTGIFVDWTVGAGIRYCENLAFNNNVYDGCTKKTLNLSGADPVWKQCTDGIILKSSNASRNITVTGNVLRNFSFEGILIATSGFVPPPPVDERLVSATTISSNSIDGKYPDGHKRKTNWGIVHSNPYSTIIGNSITGCTTGIKVVSSPNGGGNEPANDIIISDNVVIMAEASTMNSDAPESGGYGTLGIECAGNRALVANNKIIGYDLPQGTLAGWDGNPFTKPSSARIPTAITFNDGSPTGGKAQCHGNNIRIVSKTNPNVRCAAVQIDNTAPNVVSKNNKIEGCDYLVWGVNGVGSFTSDFDSCDQSLIAHSLIGTAQINNNSFWIYPTQTGWYSCRGTSSNLGSLYVKISSSLGGVSKNIGDSNGMQSTDLCIGYSLQQAQTTNRTINQISHVSVPNPIISKIALHDSIGGNSMWFYVNQVITDNSGNPMPIVISWCNNITQDYSTLYGTQRNTSIGFTYIYRPSTQPTLTIDNSLILDLEPGSRCVNQYDNPTLNLPVLSGYGVTQAKVNPVQADAKFGGQMWINQQTGKIWVAYGFFSGTWQYNWLAIN